MEKLSSLLVLLSLVTSNVYVADSYTLTASVLSQMGYNNESWTININDNNIDSIDPNAFKGYSKITHFTLISTNLLTMDIEIFKDAVNVDSIYIDTSSLNKLTNSKNIILNKIFSLYLSTNLTSLNKPIINAFASLSRFGASSNLKTIDVHTFESLSKLDTISLMHNLITSFEYLQIPKNLKQLVLSENKMNYFALSRTMGVLDYLKIDKNLFRSFKSMDFTFLANLTYLCLSDNPHAYPNEIPGHLKPLVKLRAVELANLNISTIDSNYFKNNINLHYIDLTRNKISSLDYRAFNHLKDLEMIYLHTNNLTQIGSGTFANLPKLRYVYLDNNQITKLDSSMFAGSNSLWGIFIMGNPNLSTTNIQNVCPPAAPNCQVIHD